MRVRIHRIGHHHPGMSYTYSHSGGARWLGEEPVTAFKRRLLNGEGNPRGSGPWLFGPDFRSTWAVRVEDDDGNILNTNRPQRI